MKCTWLKGTAATVFAASLLASVSAQAAATWTYADVDADGNLEVTEQEFTGAIEETEIFANWDADDDAVVDEREFHEGIFDAWDGDDDEALTTAEFEAGWGEWYDTGIPDYGVWDANADELLDEEEFAAGFGELGIYDEWDADETVGVSDAEFYDGLYDVWDVDDNEVLVQNEWYEEDDDWLF